MLDQLRLHRLIFKKPAGTSRGVLHSKPSWIFTYTTTSGRQIETEFPIIPGLSPEFQDETQYQSQLNSFLAEALTSLELWTTPAFMSSASWLQFVVKWTAYPSFIFGLEILIFSIQAEKYPLLFDTPFTRKEQSIPINGLVWMDTQMNMREQIQQKIAQGFKVVKLKIGAIAWEEELALIQELRQHFSEQQITVRVDANGAFSVQEALFKLEQLQDCDLHSIEQPIRVGEWEAMRELAQQSPIPIALDEELIGRSNKEEVLNFIQPQYIILKPSLLGGILETQEWIQLAEEMEIGWWTTSALESSIGLNAISQLTSTYLPSLPQGLGTGKLYHNNLESPLLVQAGEIQYQQDGTWETPS